jgi:hypothetical protein
MTRQLLLEEVVTSLQAEITGHLRVGEYSLAIGSGHGICLSPATERSTVTAQPLPIVQVPPAFSRFHGRQVEVETVIAALQTNQLIILSGSAGIGKSALLRHLAHHQQVTTSRPDGILYLNHCHSLDDLQQILGDRFYCSPTNIRPSDDELWQWLQDKQVVLLIEDCQLTAADCSRLTALLPNSPCVVVTAARLGVQKATEIALTGLSWPDSLTLIEQELGRLPPEQVRLAESLWQLLQGHPQRLRQAAALVREDGMPLAKVVKKLQPDGLALSLIRLILSGLPKTQRWIVALLVAMQGVSLTAEQIALMSGPPNPQTSLQALLQRYLIQLDGDRYRLAASLVDQLQVDFDAVPWMERVLQHLLPWAEQHRQCPKVMLAEQEVILHALRWTVDQELWVDALRLVRSLEGALSLGKQWQTWEQVLQWGLQAAWALEDAGAEAWALHQLGTRAACLEEVTTAYDALSQALTLRNLLGDAIGSQLTQNNLELLKSLSLPSPSVKSAIERQRVYVILGLLGAGVFAVSLVVGWVIANRLNPSPEAPTPVESWLP